MSQSEEMNSEDPASLENPLFVSRVNNVNVRPGGSSLSFSSSSTSSSSCINVKCASPPPSSRSSARKPISPPPSSRSSGRRPLGNAAGGRSEVSGSSQSELLMIPTGSPAERQRLSDSSSLRVDHSSRPSSNDDDVLRAQQHHLFAKANEHIMNLSSIP
ncbi:unnamed protein product, partial [Amoebophrya sp. A25]|eukprot:GSA25T00019398001.1